MADYKDKNGTTAVGDFLRTLKDKGVGIFEDVASGKSLATAVAGALGSGTISNEEASKIFDLEVQDRTSARDSNAKIQETVNASFLAKNTPYILAIYLCILVTLIIGTLVFVNIPEENMSTLYMVLGIVIGTFTTVIAFFFGSSQGSKDKMENLLKNLKK